MQRRILGLAALSSLALGVPVAGAQGVRGVVFGGTSAQDYPVVIELSKTGRKVVRASTVLDLECLVPPDTTLPDRFRGLPISKAGRFALTTAPTRVPANPETGAPALDVSGSIKGRVNKARTQIKGTWQLKVVAYSPADPTNATVLDSCDSGLVAYTVKQ